MFTVSDIKKTKVYQEALDEGRAEGIEEGLEQGRNEEALSLVLRQLNCRIGPLAPENETQIRNLSLTQIEQLGEALLDFSDRADLEHWLKQAE